MNIKFIALNIEILVKNMFSSLSKVYYWAIILKIWLVRFCLNLYNKKVLIPFLLVNWQLLFSQLVIKYWQLQQLAINVLYVSKFVIFLSHSSFLSRELSPLCWPDKMVWDGEDCLQKWLNQEDASNSELVPK